MENPIYELYGNLEKIITSSIVDATKFAGGNNSAGTRVRKAMQEVKHIAQNVRKEVQDQKNRCI